MGMLDLVRGRNDTRLGAHAFSGTPNETDEKRVQDGPVGAGPDHYKSDSDGLSLEEKNEKEVIENPDHITSDAQLGVKKAEAAALVWPKWAVYATYAW